MVSVATIVFLTILTTSCVKHVRNSVFKELSHGLRILKSLDSIFQIRRLYRD